MLLDMDADTAEGTTGIQFKADSTNDDRRIKGGIFFRRHDPGTRGTGDMHFSTRGDNSDTNVSQGDWKLKITSNANHATGTGGSLVMASNSDCVVGRDYTSGTLTNGQSVSWNGSGTTFTNGSLNMNGLGGNGGCWICGISVSAADGNPSGAAIQVGVHGQGFNNFSTLVNNFDSGLSVTIGAQISISNTSGDTVYYRLNVIHLGSQRTTVYGR